MTIRSTLLTLLALAPLACGAPKADTAQPEPAPAPAPTPVAKPAAKPIPDGFFVLTPQLTVKGVDQAIEFYARAFGATKVLAMPGPDGKTMHAEIKIGDSLVFLDEENVAEGMKSPLTLGGSPGSLMVYVADADQTYAAAVTAGAKAEMPLEDQFWGDRYGQVIDPFGHRWAVGTHVEDLTAEQTQQRAALAFAPPAKGAKKPAKPAKGKPAEPAWKKIAGTPAKQPVPGEYHTVTVSLTVAKAAEAIEFYKAAFGATEKDRMAMPDGKIMHTELRIGDSALMLADEFPDMGGYKSATALGGSPIALHYYTPDVDANFAKITAAGAKQIMPVTDMFWGDRYGAVVDPSGYMWGVATHTEDLSPEQMAERMKRDMAKGQKPTT